MHTIEIPEAKIKRLFPSDLSECDKYQYIDMCGLIFDYQNGKITYNDLRVHAVYRLLDMKHRKAPFQEGEDEKHSNIYMLSELVDDFFEENENGQKIIKQYYIHNPVPSFRPAWKTYYGPADSFINMTWGEYREALRLFNDFHATGEMEILYLLAAIFYRPKKSFHFIKKRMSNYDGDIREAYNGNILEKRAKALRYAPIGFIYGVYLLFASFQKHIVTAEIMWGGRELDLSILFDAPAEEATPSTSLPGIGMDSIAFAMAESGTFGNLTQVDKTNFWQIIVRMYELKRNDIELKKQERNASNK